MRVGSPATYACKKSGDRGMHRWTRTPTGAQCTYCKLEIDQADAADVFNDRNTISIRKPS